MPLKAKGHRRGAPGEGRAVSDEEGPIQQIQNRLGADIANAGTASWQTPNN